jgi:hypothetical protein
VWGWCAVRDLNPYFLLVRHLLWYWHTMYLFTITYRTFEEAVCAEVCALVRISKISLTGSRGSAVLLMLP